MYAMHNQRWLMNLMHHLKASVGFKIDINQSSKLKT
jgi:hypothetical protein